MVNKDQIGKYVIWPSAITWSNTSINNEWSQIKCSPADSSDYLD